MRSFQKIRTSINKNLPEMQAFFSGKMPGFMYGQRFFTDIPVFCFHSVEPVQFERQLQFLAENGYVSLHAEDLELRLKDASYTNSGKEIVLTFDDGLESLWSVAFPLLRKYQQRVICFLLPGLIAENRATGLTNGIAEPVISASLEQRLERTTVSLCTWKQIEDMHESGVVDFQSHGMRHPLVSISPKVVDFIAPESGIYSFGNSQIPLYGDGTPEGDSRANVPGHPVYENASRFSDRYRYFDDLRLREICEEAVRRRGGIDFFLEKNWKAILFRLVEVARKKYRLQGRFESDEEMEKAILFELSESKKIIERRLSGKVVKHFCAPWYVGSELVARMAYDLGYAAFHLGAFQGFSLKACQQYPSFILRLQQEYLRMLPGKGRAGFSNTLGQKFKISSTRSI